MDVMGPIAWIILGGLAGWLASKFVGRDKGQGVIGNIIVGIIGAVVGGWVFGLLGGSGVDGFNIGSFIVALVGAIIVLWVWECLLTKRASYSYGFGVGRSRNRAAHTIPGSAR